MDRRDFLKITGAAAIAATIPTAEPTWRPVHTFAGYSEGPWTWTAQLNHMSRYWHVKGLHVPTKVRLELLVPETYLVNRGIGIDTYLAERPSVHIPYINKVLAG